jgi:hypothetical protein
MVASGPVEYLVCAAGCGHGFFELFWYAPGRGVMIDYLGDVAAELNVSKDVPPVNIGSIGPPGNVSMVA